MTVDNIKFEFFGSLGVSCAGYQGWVNTIVQNCEIGWCGGEYKNENDGSIYITNNLFYLSEYVLVHCFMPKENQPIFSGNTYAQGEKGWLAILRGRMLSITEYGEKYVHNELSDKTGTVLVVK